MIVKFKVQRRNFADRDDALYHISDEDFIGIFEVMLREYAFIDGLRRKFDNAPTHHTIDKATFQRWREELCAFCPEDAGAKACAVPVRFQACLDRCLGDFDSHPPPPIGGGLCRG